MKLREFINASPRDKRMALRRCIAGAHGVAEVTVRSWANGTRNHPGRLAAVRITEDLTGGQVTRYDLRPDIYGPAKRGTGVKKGRARRRVSVRRG